MENSTSPNNSMVDDSMHASSIRKDATDHVPQVMSNMRRFKSTVNEFRDKTSSTDEEDTNSIESDDDNQMNQLDTNNRKNKNIINLTYNQKDGLTANKTCCNCIACKVRYNKCCYSLPIFHPHGNLRIAWDCIIMLILIYTCVEIPYTMAFGITLTLHDAFGVIALFIDCFLLVDVMLNFRTAYFDEFDHQKLVANPHRIAYKYLTTWFTLDFITSFPFEFLIPDSAAGNLPVLIKALRIFRMVRLLKLLRFFRMLKTFNSIIASFMTRSIIIIAKLFKLLCLMTLSAHFVACLWFYVGNLSYAQHGRGHSWLYPDAEDPSSSLLEMPIEEQYLTSFYFAVVTLYTTGYGDITPKSLTEKFTCSACILVGTCFFAYFIGAVGSLVADGDRVKCAQIQKVEEAQAFCTSKKLPAQVAHAVMSHARYHWQRNFVFDDLDVMNALPGYLRRDVGKCLAERYFNELPIFDHLSEYIRGLIALRLKCVSCNADYELFHAQQYGKEMFIQRTGVSYLLDHNKKMHKITRGGVIGYSALLNPVRQTTVKCSSWCEFYALDRDDIQDILRSNFPRAWRPLWIQIKNRIKELLQQNMDTLNINIKRSKDALFSKDTPHTASTAILPTISSNSSTSLSSCSLETIPTNRSKPSLRRIPSLRLISSDSLVVSQTVKAAKKTKKGTQRKIKKILQVSDSEMRNDKVLTKPPLNKLRKDKKAYKQYERKLRSRMMKRRCKRELKGVDEIIPKFNNNVSMINYFADIIEQEQSEQEMECVASEEEQYEHDDDSMEWDADQDSGGEIGGNASRRRGVSGVGKRGAAGFKGMAKIKMNKSSTGIKKNRPKLGKKRKSKKSVTNVFLNDGEKIELIKTNNTKKEHIINLSEKESLLNKSGEDSLKST